MNKFLDLAYKGLGLDASGYDIGTARFIDLPPEVFYTICSHRLEDVLWGLHELWEQDDPEWEPIAVSDGFMLYKEWLHLVKHARSYTVPNLKDPDPQKRCDNLIERYAVRLYNLHRYNHNFDGWKSYLCDASPFFAERLLYKEFPVRLPREKVLNCYIVASSQSGKTELLKLFAHSIITQEREALICIEPAGDASRQIALWPECKDRLIYVDLSLDLSRAPTVNPFEIYGIKAQESSPAALDVKTVVAQQLLTAFQEVLGTGAGAELSKNMRTIVFNLAEGSLGELESSAFGRLLVATLQSIAVRRDKQNKRVPTRVIIDEFHNFTTRSMEKVITQAAKFDLYLLMANQQISQITNKEIRDAILNVSVLIGGRNSPSFHGPVASMLNVPPETIGGLDRGDFIVHLAGVPPLQFRIKENLLKFEHRMSEQEWEAVKADQLRRYYRLVEAPVPAPSNRRPVPAPITEDENIF